MAKGTDKLANSITQETGDEADLRHLKDDEFGSQRVYKKTSPNSLLTLYLGTRDVICRHGSVEPLRGVIYIDPKFTPSNKIYGQLTLTFRYGREDEEVMGLKFCNEAIIALKQIWPVPEDTQEDLSTLQRALLDRLGKHAFAFALDVGALAPPSVQLVPAKRYNGAPIGTSYDVRIHMAGDQHEERPPSRRCMVKLGVRVIHKITSSLHCSPEQMTALNAAQSHNAAALMSKTLRMRLSPKSIQLANKLSTVQSGSGVGSAVQPESGQRLSADGVGWPLDAHRVAANNNDGGSASRIDVERGGSGSDSKGPEGSVDKPFLWTEGRVSLRAALNKSAYGHGEHISVTIDVRNDSRKIIRKVRIFAVQHVDVCMFSNGKFKNVVAEINESLLIKPGEHHRKIYSLLPIRGPTKNWIAVEGSTSYSGPGSSSYASGSIRSAAAVAASARISGGKEHGHSASMLAFNYKIASSAPRLQSASTEDRNVFAIYVSYYIKVKLTLSAMGGEVTLKLPFILGHVDDSGLQLSQQLQPQQADEATQPEIQQDVNCSDAVTTATTASASHRTVAQSDVIVIDDDLLMSSSNKGVDNGNKNLPDTPVATLDDIVVEFAALTASTAAAAAETVATTVSTDDDITTTTLNNVGDVNVITTSTATSVSTASDDEPSSQFRRTSVVNSSNYKPNRAAETEAPPFCNIVTAQVHSSAI